MKKSAEEGKAKSAWLKWEEHYEGVDISECRIVKGLGQADEHRGMMTQAFPRTNPGQMSGEARARAYASRRVVSPSHAGGLGTVEWRGAPNADALG